MKGLKGIVLTAIASMMIGTSTPAVAGDLHERDGDLVRNKTFNVCSWENFPTDKTPDVREGSIEDYLIPTRFNLKTTPLKNTKITLYGTCDTWKKSIYNQVWDDLIKSNPSEENLYKVDYVNPSNGTTFNYIVGIGKREVNVGLLKKPEGIIPTTVANYVGLRMFGKDRSAKKVIQDRPYHHNLLDSSYINVVNDFNKISWEMYKGDMGSKTDHSDKEIYDIAKETLPFTLGYLTDSWKYAEELEPFFFRKTDSGLENVTAKDIRKREGAIYIETIFSKLEEMRFDFDGVLDEMVKKSDKIQSWHWSERGTMTGHYQNILPHYSNMNAIMEECENLYDIWTVKCLREQDKRNDFKDFNTPQHMVKDLIESYMAEFERLESKYSLDFKRAKNILNR